MQNTLLTPKHNHGVALAAVFKKNSFLLISVLLHLIVIYVVAQSVITPSGEDLPVKKPDVIQATLIFDSPLPPPEMPVELIKEEVPQPEEPEVAEIPQDSPIEPIVEPEVQTIPTVVPPETQPAKHEEEVEDEPQQSQEINEITPIDKNLTPISSSDMHIPVTSMARRHLSGFQQRQRNSIAQQASRTYQQRKNSPIIDAEIKNPFMSDDEKLRDSLKVRADCSSTSKKTTAILLGFLGGGIECSAPPDIDSFISDRLTKKSLLPGQYRQQDQKIPQSIVVKKRY